MKIISLNAYFGSLFEPLMAFIAREAPTTDIFSFQEMLSNPAQDLSVLPKEHFKHEARPDIVHDIAKQLPDFEMVFAPMHDDFDIVPAYPEQMQLGLAIFYRKTLPVTERGDFFIYNKRNAYDGKNYETAGHNAVYIGIDSPIPLTIVGLHGNSEPAHKLDTPKRLQQSQKIIDFLSTRPGEKIVMGDFNLFPDTESVKLFETAGFRNLIKDYRITNTRGTLMRKLFPEYEKGKYGFQDFADYTFITPGINVKSFEVPDLPISDHLPMILECE